MLLRRALIRRLGQFAMPTVELAKLWGAATVAAVTATAVRLAVPELPPIGQALLVVPTFGASYLTITSWLDIPEAAVLTGRVLAKLRRRS